MQTYRVYVRGGFISSWGEWVPLFIYLAALKKTTVFALMCYNGIIVAIIYGNFIAIICMYDGVSLSIHISIWCISARVCWTGTWSNLDHRAQRIEQEREREKEKWKKARQQHTFDLSISLSLLGQLLFSAINSTCHWWMASASAMLLSLFTLFVCMSVYVR